MGQLSPIEGQGKEEVGETQKKEAIEQLFKGRGGRATTPKEEIANA